MKKWKDLNEDEKIKLIKKIINALFRWILPLAICIFCIIYLASGWSGGSLNVVKIILIVFSAAIAWYALGVIGSWIEELIKGIININKLKKDLEL